MSVLSYCDYYFLTGAKELWRVLRSVLMGESSVLDDSDEEFDGEEGLDGGESDDDEDDEEGGSDGGGMREDGKGSAGMGRVSTSAKASTISTSAKASTISTLPRLAQSAQLPRLAQSAQLPRLAPR